MSGEKIQMKPGVLLPQTYVWCCYLFSML